MLAHILISLVKQYVFHVCLFLNEVTVFYVDDLQILILLIKIEHLDNVYERFVILRQHTSTSLG